jgi:hypothetical protein
MKRSVCLAWRNRRVLIESPCASATAECLVVKFQPPGLGEHDSISFSKSILNGDAPIRGVLTAFGVFCG